MKGQWRNDENDVPARVGRALSKTRHGASSARTVSIAASVVAAVLVVTVVIAVATSGGGDDDSSTMTGAEGSTPPDSAATEFTDGVYEFRVGHSGQCLAAGPQPDNDSRTVLIQQDCKKAAPELSLKQAEGGYQITMDFTKDDWVACLTADEPADEPGYLLGPQECADDPLQTFQLAGVAEGGHYIKTSTGLCVGIYGKSEDKGAAAEVTTCDGGQSQTFAIAAKGGEAGDDGTDAPQSFPKDGRYRIAVKHSSLCLGSAKQEGHDRDVVTQQDCAKAKPSLEVVTVKTGVVRVKMHYTADHYVACLALDAPGDEVGYLYGPQQCEDGDKLQEFSLQQVSEDVYLIKSGDDMCMDIWEHDTAKGATAVVAQCDAAAPSQQFTFTGE